MDHDLWARLGTSDSGLAQLRLFAALVEKWTQRINLVAKSTLPDLWSRHIEDSARLALLVPEPPAIWADFGSGGGFPGIVVAVILADRGAATRMILVESDQRKAAFLREAVRQLSLNAAVRSERAETLPPLNAGIVSARALSALPALCDLAARHLAPGGVALFPKGETHAAETAEARKIWQFDLETHADPGHKGSAILELRNIHRAGDQPRPRP